MDSVERKKKMSEVLVRDHFLFDDVNRHTVININKSRHTKNGTVAWPSLKSALAFTFPVYDFLKDGFCPFKYV